MKHYSLLSFLAFILVGCSKVLAPQPYGVIPTPQQIEWQKMETYMFIHFGPNTFTNVEWGDGKEDPKVFNPSDLDCRQWAATAKAAGMKAIILTAKHHDGFCLWPSKFSKHTVRESAWKDGKGDLLKDLSEACREYGLKFGVYLSPWDQNHPSYGTVGYNDVFANTLDEVYTSYGDIFEQWFDGANGEGKDGKYQVYDWEKFHNILYKHNPNIIIFSDIGPGCRWMGNERGKAGETNWSTLNTKGWGVGRESPPTDTLNTGNKNGEKWVPAEVDVSIRPGWFYSPTTDNRVKSLEQIVDIYYTSVGRNANLLLNVPPDRRGRIHPNDSTRLMEFHRVIEETFAVNLAIDAKITASNTRGRGYNTTNLVDESYDTYWTTSDDLTSATLEIAWKQPQTVNRLLLQEYIPLGQRVEKFSADYWDDTRQEWEKLTEGTTIGYKRILRFPLVTTSKVRVNIEKSLACPILNNLGLYRGHEFLSDPEIARSKEGVVTLQCTSPDLAIYYTTDGTIPSENSIRYKASFDFASGGVLKAIAFDGSSKSAVVDVQFDIAPAKWKVHSPNAKDTYKAIDGNPKTMVSMKYAEPLVIDLGESLTLKGITYTPVASPDAPNVSKYDVSVSPDGITWKSIKRSSFDNIKNSPVKQNVLFDAAVEGRFLKFTAKETTVDKGNYVVSELGVITR